MLQENSLNFACSRNKKKKLSTNNRVTASSVYGQQTYILNNVQGPLEQGILWSDGGSQPPKGFEKYFPGGKKPTESSNKDTPNASKPEPSTPKKNIFEFGGSGSGGGGNKNSGEK